MDIEENYARLLHVEPIIVESLRPYLSGDLSENICKQLTLILEEQFSPERCGEVGGCIVPKKDGSLELLMVESEEKMSLEQALEDYKTNSLSDASQKNLLHYAEFIKDENEKALGRDHLGVQYAILVCDIFSIPLDSPKQQKLDGKRREEAVSMYKEWILNSFYSFSTCRKNPRYIALFHVHDNGTEPSSHDIRRNKNFPLVDLVISAKKDYQQQGVKLYLVHSGSFELLYQGLLQPIPEK